MAAGFTPFHGVFGNDSFSRCYMRLVFCAFLLFVWVGCGEGGAASGTKEGVGGDVLADVINDIPVMLNETRDELEEGLEVWDINELEEIGGLIECSTSQDCPSSVCVLAPDGKKYCAPFCVDQPCPEGWECTQITPIGGDTTFVCLPKATYLCRPCLKKRRLCTCGIA
jgi:hypothetical protein